MALIRVNKIKYGVLTSLSLTGNTVISLMYEVFLNLIILTTS